MSTPAALPAMQTVAVLRSDDFRVKEGVAETEGITFADELVMDDIYQLSQAANRIPLSLATRDGQDGFEIAPGTAIGKPGNAVYLDSCITLMGDDSSTYEVLVLVEVEDGALEATYLLPLANLVANTNYRLVGVDTDTATIRFAEVACVSFTRGTHITLASGEQRPIENLRIGDKVLTRDDGSQAVRWIGQTTIRAVGEFAPIVITKGALHNENDLLVSPDHRLFVYQRQDKLGAGRSEVLVKVRHLVNGDTVYRRDGGFVDYFQLLFDVHQIIYAEGIAAESLLIDPRTRAAMPDNVRANGTRSDHAHRPHQDYEVQEKLLAHPNAVDLLRKASSN
jgi:hypothetical protein